MKITTYYTPCPYTPSILPIQYRRRNFLNELKVSTLSENLKKKKWIKNFKKVSPRLKLLLLRLKNKNPLLALTLAALFKELESPTTSPGCVFFNNAFLSEFSLVTTIQNLLNKQIKSKEVQNHFES